jgi:nucleoside triphosphate diphosphatase
VRARAASAPLAGARLDALERLDAITRQLRRECPWDREQDERSIVPHTVEEAEEVAEAVRSGDDEALIEELGDLLFQVMFLSLLLEERGVSDLAAVAERLREKLIRRHPHVFGDLHAETAEDAKAIWRQMKEHERR